MGSVLKYLHQSDLPDRELHHSRMFIDLAENIHIHFREYRIVFDLDEYFEFASILGQSTLDVRNFLEQNPDYEHDKYPTTIMIAGGKERQLKFLSNSPKPNKSKYFDELFAIELQDAFVTDEIHIHYRDFRLAMDRERFRAVANGFVEALDELNKFEEKNGYDREYHPDHVIVDANADGKLDTTSAKLMGTVLVDIEAISSPHLRSNSFKPQREAIKQLKKEITEGRLTPILLSTEENGEHFIIDGHHRFFAAKELGNNQINAIVTDISYEQSHHLREAEKSLKKFDAETNYRFGMSDFMKSFLGYRLNRFYANAYKTKMLRQTIFWRFLRKVKRAIFGKKQLFKKFNEPHNHHN